MSATGPSALPVSDVERLRRLERVVDAIRQTNEGDDIVDILKALTPMLQQNGNGTKTKVAGIIATLSLAGVVGGFLAVKVISQGEAIASLQTEIQSCIKKQ